MSESEFTLLYNGRIVKSTSDTLISNQIEDGCVIHLVQRALMGHNSSENVANQTEPPVEDPRRFVLEYVERFSSYPRDESSPLAYAGNITNDSMQLQLQQIASTFRYLEQSWDSLLASFHEMNAHAMFGIRADQNFVQLLPYLTESASHVSEIFNILSTMTNTNREEVNSPRIQPLRDRFRTLWTEFWLNMRQFSRLFLQIDSPFAFSGSRQLPESPRVPDGRSNPARQGNPSATIHINATVFETSGATRQPRVVSTVNRQFTTGSTAQHAPPEDISSLSQDVQAVISNDIAMFNSRSTEARFPLSIGYRMGHPRSFEILHDMQVVEENLTNFASLASIDIRFLELVSPNCQFQRAFSDYLEKQFINKLYKKYVISKIRKRLSR